MKKSILLILVVFFFLTTFLCLSANSSVTYEDFLVMWQRAQTNIEINNPDGHSGFYTDTEIIPEDIELNFGWIEGIGIWGIKKGFNWFGSGVIPVIQMGYYDNNGVYYPTGLHKETPRVEDENYIYFQLTLPPDPVNIPPETTFPSTGFYIPDDGL